MFITYDGECKDQILLALLHAGEDGLKRTQIGKIVKGFSPARITQSLDELEGKKKIGKIDDGNYVILGPGEKYISSKLVEIDK